MAGFDPSTPVTFGLLAIAISVVAGGFGAALWLSSKLEKLRTDVSERHDKLNSDVLNKIGNISGSIQTALSESRLHADRLFSDTGARIDRIATELNDHRVETARLYVAKDDLERLAQIARQGANGSIRTK